MSLPAPNAIHCFECGELTYMEGPTSDSGCPSCEGEGTEDIWCYEVVSAVPCPDPDDCSSDFCNHRGTHVIDVNEADDALEGRDYGAKQSLPPACPKPCNECPWRGDSIGGWLGPYTAAEWVTLANSDEPIACHTTIEIDEAWTPKTRQCAGSASYRKATGKLPRDREVVVGPVHDNCFINRQDFLDHHLRVKVGR